MSSRLQSLKQTLLPVVTTMTGLLPATKAIGGVGHILSLHRVVPRSEMSPYAMSAFEITPEILEQTVAFFRERGYDIVSPGEVHRRLVERVNGRRFVLFEFDDGYRDTLANAYPIMQKYEAPFTVNVVVGYTDRTAIKWDYLAQDIVARGETIEVPNGDGSRLLDCSDPDRRRRAFAFLLNHLQTMNRPEAYEQLETFFRRFTSDPFAKTDELTMDWEQIKRISRDPLVTIGAHSVNHFILSKLEESIARREMQEARRRLESEIDAPVRSFCYPYGTPAEIGPRELGLAADSYDIATTGTKGSLFPDHAEHLTALPRFNIGSNCDRSYLAIVSNGVLALLVNRRRFATL